jgi:hypothetical protein
LQGRSDDARAQLQELAKDGFTALPLDMEWLLGLGLIAETSAVLDERSCVPALYQLLLPWGKFNVVDTPEAMRGSASRYLGLLAHALERRDDAEQHFKDAIAMN